MAQVDRTEFAAKPDLGIPKSLQEFLVRVAQPLSAWNTTMNEANENRLRFLGEKGSVRTLAIESGQFFIELGKRANRHGPNSIAAMQAKQGVVVIGGNTNAQYLELHTKKALRYVMTPGNKPFINTAVNMSANISPRDREATKEFNGRFKEVHDEFQREHRRINSAWVKQGNMIVEPFKEYVSDSFVNFREFCEYIRQVDSPEVTAIVRLLGHAEQDPLKQAVSGGRQKEEKNPTKKTLEDLFTQTANAYYTNGQKDELWVGLSLLLSPPEIDLAEIFTNTDHERQRQILKPIVDAILTKGVPPIITERLRQLLLGEQAQAWHYLESRGQSAKRADTSYTVPAEKAEAITWTQRKKRIGQVHHPDQPQPNGSKTETEITPKRLIVFMHKDGVCTSSAEEELAGQIRHFFASMGAREFTNSDVDAYVMILAKKAGLRKNATGYIEEKVRAVDPVTFSSGGKLEKTPFYILRRKENSAPRLGVAFPQGRLVLLTAWDREDNSYSKNQRDSRFTFGIVTLPAALQPSASSNATAKAVS